MAWRAGLSSGDLRHLATDANCGERSAIPVLALSGQLDPAIAQKRAKLIAGLPRKLVITPRVRSPLALAAGRTRQFRSVNPGQPDAVSPAPDCVPIVHADVVTGARRSKQPGRRQFAIYGQAMTGHVTAPIVCSLDDPGSVPLLGRHQDR